MPACYTDRLSVAPGETFALHASARGPCRLTIDRVGVARERVLSLEGVAARALPTPPNADRDDADRDGRGWPAVVHHRRLHTINVFAWAAKGAVLPAIRSSRRDGYSLIEWKRGGLEFWAVSDIDQTELGQFQAAFSERS